MLSCIFSASSFAEKEKKKDTISGAKIQCYWNEDAISSSRFVPVRNAQAGGSVPLLRHASWWPWSRFPGTAKGQHWPWLPAQHPCVGMDSQVFIQLLCSWLALVNEARAQFRPLLLCRGGKGLLSSHSLFPNVSPAPWQVRKSVSEQLFALFLWHFVVPWSHRNVWGWRIVVCSCGITHHGQHRSSWNTWGVHILSQQWV